MKRLIKVINKDTALRLEAEGFRHMIENIDNQEVFVFIESEELMRLLNDKKNYSKKHWFIDKNNTLRF